MVVMTFTPMPYQLSPETVAARKKKREEKLHQTFDETLAEVRRERKQIRVGQFRKVIRSSATGTWRTSR